jgi:hypothetical protein
MNIFEKLNKIYFKKKNMKSFENQTEEVSKRKT